MNKEVIGYGSFFHKIDPSAFKSLPEVKLATDYELFYSGRNAIKYILLLIGTSRKVNKIWMPGYYCPDVKSCLELEFSNICYYDINPFDPNDKIDWSIFSNPEDILIVNNFWGLKQYRIPNNNRPVVIEDHSHGWQSNGCLESTADFCIASLRKTVPLPLGGIAWKPSSSRIDIPLRQENLFEIQRPDNDMERSWELISKAMELKAGCKHSGDKKQYLELYAQGESILRSNFDIFPIESSKTHLLEKLIFKNYRYYKEHNSKLIIPKIEKNDFFSILSHEDFTPFGLLLIFKNRSELVSLKKYLISKSIYPAELWPDNDINFEYNFLLNIHLDFRYGKKDLEYIAHGINTWAKHYSADV
jgi:hypothetical protein